MDTQLELKREPRRSPRINRRHVVTACAMLLIALAVVLNVVLFTGQTPVVEEPDTDVGTGADGTQNGADTAVDGYFSATQVSRQRARDEALEVLQSVVDNAGTDEATKTGALAEISALAEAMEAEANIETLVLAKGFAQCVAVINGESCSVVVKGEGELAPAQISQINEIVFEQAGIQPVNVKIIAK